MPKTTQFLKSVGKTINLAKPQVYQVPRKPPLNSLVFEKLPEQKCGDRIAISKPPTPTPVRVCTKEELQALYCCPKPCDCKVKTKMTTAEKIACLLKSAVKIYILKQLVEYTWREGLWSDAFRSSCFLEKYLEYCPETKEDPINMYASSDCITMPVEEPCLPYIPRSDYVLYRSGKYWNRMVIRFFWIILDGPSELWAFVQKAYNERNNPKQTACDKILHRKY
ncbi:UNVERIFIED_CONTAM: hypothetical protein PYX00_009424 [Menopon gallinae]|uniref:Uncharacterized protein n=1 Tax=Menopon gallinae TaxID=328185 RepID=A0AAW2HBY2_9NEOP